DEAWISCQYYLRSHPRYEKAEQLDQLGWRQDKQWFRANDMREKTEKLITILPQNEKMSFPFISKNSKLLRDLFNLLQHPYIFPVCAIDFITEQNLVVVVLPVSTKGSLKDFIYKSRFTTSSSDKYRNKSKGLSVKQIALFGRQILEALIYMEEKGFPIHGHLHSGNIILDNGVCRVSGYENTFLGYTSNVYEKVRRKIKHNREALDVVCFGHLLYEMSTGCELDTPFPEPHHLTYGAEPLPCQGKITLE
ncbi:hypothetical protein FSP39_009753, partial [Pinctada imbricata]